MPSKLSLYRRINNFLLAFFKFYKIHVVSFQGGREKTPEPRVPHLSPFPHQWVVSDVLQSDYNILGGRCYLSPFHGSSKLW